MQNNRHRHHKLLDNILNKMIIMVLNQNSKNSRVVIQNNSFKVFKFLNNKNKNCKIKIMIMKVFKIVLLELKKYSLSNHNFKIKCKMIFKILNLLSLTINLKYKVDLK